MSSQLERRLQELSEERMRLRNRRWERIGKTFASNLDRPALLELALKTAVDAVQAGSGRLSAREPESDRLTEVAREGSLDGLDEAILKAEGEAMASGDTAQASTGDTHVVTVPLGPLDPDPRVHGLITVARRERTFSEDDLAVLRSLAGQAALAHGER